MIAVTRAALPTRTVAVDAEHPEADVINEAVRVLRAGGLVAVPTETVYGLGGRALDEPSLARIFTAKGRPANHPLIAHVLGEADARGLAAVWSPAAARLAAAFWPGPLTLVVPRAAHVPAALAGGGDAVAVRAPSHPVARALIAALGEPLAAPSANRFQSLSPTTAAHVLRTLAGRVELVLDGGPCHAGIESTVVDVAGDAPRILRPGALDVAALRVVLPDICMASRDVAADVVRASPGMDPRHYAPRAELRIVPSRAAAVAAVRAETAAGVALLVRGVVGDGMGDVPEAVDVRVLDDAPAAYARELFATLHALDDAGARLVVVEAVPDDEAWAAVADRLRRGSTA